MVNSSKKVRLQKLLLEHMKLQVEEIGITVIYCHCELSTNLSTGVTSDEFGLKLPEADTMLLSIYAKLRMDNVSDIEVLDSEDTDVYVQAAYVSRQVRGDLMMKRKNNYIYCCAMLTEDVAKIIIPLHVMSGSDHTSSFYGHGKKKLLPCVASCTLMMMGTAVEINRKRRRKRRKCWVKPWIKLRPISAGRGSHHSYFLPIGLTPRTT